MRTSKKEKGCGRALYPAKKNIFCGDVLKNDRELDLFSGQLKRTIQSALHVLSCK